MTERLVVVGGDAAGMAAASQARRRRDADDLEIVAFERGNYVSYSACGIPYWIAGDLEAPEDLVARTVQEFRGTWSIDLRMNTEVVDIDLDRRDIGFVHDGASSRIGFDELVIATGAAPFRPPIEGIAAPNVFGVQVLDDGVAVRERLESPAREAVVIGGGYIGVEMAETLVRRGLHVTLVEQAPEPMSTLDPDMGRLVRTAMTDMGMDVRSHETVQGLEPHHDGTVGVVTDKSTLSADVVVLGLGVRPNTELAKAAGVQTGVLDAISTDRRMRTTVPGVWAAGDCVENYHLVSRRPVYVPLGTHANKQGRVVGINIGGGYATFPGVVGTAATKVCDLEIARTGLLEREATAAGFEFVTAIVDSTTRAGYFPGSTPITVKVIAERRSGRLLGAQIVGREGSGKRIDAFAVALWNEMTVEEMTGLDLSYAPPFAPVWDPILIAARKAWDAVASG